MVWNSPLVTVTGITDTSTLNYYVSYKNRESKTTRQIRSFTEQASLNLKANTIYEIKVKSLKLFDSRVAGSWSDSLTIKTNESGKGCTRNHLSSDQYSKQYISFLLVHPSASDSVTDDHTRYSTPVADSVGKGKLCSSAWSKAEAAASGIYMPLTVTKISLNLKINPNLCGPLKEERIPVPLIH